MYDVHALLKRFYDEEVRLGADGRARLAELRDTNLSRLEGGLAQLGPMRGAEAALFHDFCDQGSYAMHTLNKHPDNAYDIDTAVVFSEDALPASPLEARKRVAEALGLSGAPFARDPEARTNAVTVWYAAGHHVDLAVYREVTVGGVSWLEHAGAQWSRRDPKEVTEWFIKEVVRRSPSSSDRTTVDKGQLRRVVRLLKKFARSRSSWSLPGGFVLTVLAVEQYVPDEARDDIAFYKTLDGIRRRVSANPRVVNPVNGASLTTKEQHLSQVRRLGERLDEVLPKLAPLFSLQCTEVQARRAWNEIFKHEFWSREPVVKVSSSATEGQLGVLDIKVEVTDRDGGRVRMPYREGQRLPKDAWLRFSLDGVTLTSAQEIWWVVENEGDEARAANDMGHAKHGRDRATWRHTAYKGVHRMICELREGGRVLRRGIRTVKVAA